MNSPCPPVTCGPPLARPHASYTGALPGARHGLKRVQSAAEPASASRLIVRCDGSLIVACLPLPQRSIMFGLAPPASPPSHSLQPIEQPTENHRQVCADSHASVPFVQAHG